MAFSIREFKSQMDLFGGPARGSLFEVIITPPSGIKSRANSRDMAFFCKNAQIPGMVVGVAENQQVAQFRKMMPNNISTEPVQTLFLCDSDHQVASFFHSWVQRVVNYSTQGGTFSEVNGMLPFEIGYKNEYSCRVTIRQYSTHYEKSGSYYEVILDNAFPILIGDMDLAWENNDQYMVLPVQFQYDRIQYAGEKIGSPSARFGRGNGLLGMINAIGSFGQLIGQDLVPQSVQDAVNKYAAGKNAFERIFGS